MCNLGEIPSLGLQPQVSNQHLSNARGSGSQGVQVAVVMWSALRGPFAPSAAAAGQGALAFAGQESPGCTYPWNGGTGAIATHGISGHSSCHGQCSLHLAVCLARQLLLSCPLSAAGLQAGSVWCVTSTVRGTKPWPYVAQPCGVGTVPVAAREGGGALGLGERGSVCGPPSAPYCSPGLLGRLAGACSCLPQIHLVFTLQRPLGC